MMSDFNFGPAFKDEKYVYGACRPDYDSEEISDWIRFMQRQKIKGVCCLLEKQKISHYPIDLIRRYNEVFGEENVLVSSIEDYKPCTREQLASSGNHSEGVLYFLEKFAEKRRRVVVHCSAGSGRTGQIMASWLSWSQGYDSSRAIQIVESMGRYPRECCGQGTSEDHILSVLDFSRFPESLHSRMLRKHPLHLAIGKELTKYFSKSAEVILDEACGGEQHIPLVIGDLKNRKTQMCNADCILVVKGQVRVIVEIEESKSKCSPTTIYGKYLQAALATHYVRREIKKYSDRVLFVQVLDASKCLMPGSKKAVQGQLIEEQIRSLLPLKNQGITDYELLFVDGKGDNEGINRVCKTIASIFD